MLVSRRLILQIRLTVLVESSLIVEQIHLISPRIERVPQVKWPQVVQHVCKQLIMHAKQNQGLLASWQEFKPLKALITNVTFQEFLRSLWVCPGLDPGVEWRRVGCSKQQSV